MDGDALVSRGILRGNIRGRIIARIVEDNEFPMGISLTENAFDTLLEELGAVKHRRDNAYEGQLGQCTESQDKIANCHGERDQALL